jgi:hypothetical protein
MKCKACQKEIVFLRTEKGKQIPVNADTVDVVEKNGIPWCVDEYFDHTRHVSHFSDCPKAAEFRRKGA